MMHRVELSEDAIRAQVQRIVGSDLFRASEIQRRLFVYLAKKSLDGEADQLKEYTVGVEGIGKSESYDPRRDSTVRLQTGKLRQKMTEYYLAAGRADPIQIDFPKGMRAEICDGRIGFRWPNLIMGLITGLGFRSRRGVD